MNLPSIAISIRQPWAWFIVNGVKDVENRSWPLPHKYVGTDVLIHAGINPKFSMSEALEIIRMKHERPGLYGTMTCFRAGREVGGIVGVARIIECSRGHHSPWAEPDSWHWSIADAKPLPFMPFKGQLGFFPVTYRQPTPDVGQGRLV